MDRTNRVKIWCQALTCSLTKGEI